MRAEAGQSFVCPELVTHLFHKSYSPFYRCCIPGAQCYACGHRSALYPHMAVSPVDSAMQSATVTAVDLGGYPIGLCTVANGVMYVQTFMHA